MTSMRLLLLLTLTVVTAASLQAQIVWVEQTANHNLPAGIRVWVGQNTSTREYLTRVEADLSNPAITAQAYYSIPYKTTTTFSRDVGAYISINGGFFDIAGGGSVSTVITGNELLYATPKQSTISGKVFPFMRAFFGLGADLTPRIDWIHHFTPAIEDLYRFDLPPNNQTGAPAPMPTRAEGHYYGDVLTGVGAGPNLVEGGVVNVRRFEELYNNGLQWDQRVPRSAVGIKADGKTVVFLTGDSGVMMADFNFSGGLTLQRLAEILVEIGVVKGMNLDGGGSTTMAVRGSLLSKPSGGTQQRPVPTILSIIPIDSLKRPVPPIDELELDTEFSGQVQVNGAGWFQSQNIGYFGESRAWVHPTGDGSATVSYSPGLNKALYDVYGWWVSATNRAADTPYIVVHRNGRDTVRVNQQQNGSRWVKLGSWEFSGTTADQVLISNAATPGAGATYVVADALRFVQTGPTDTSTEESGQWTAPRYELLSNYPNPFNPTTLIRFRMAEAGAVRVAVYDLLGREIAVLVNGTMPEGTHEATFDATDLASGVYVYRLETAAGVQSRIMTLVR